jgi:hypothetical protein
LFSLNGDTLFNVVHLSLAVNGPLIFVAKTRKTVVWANANQLKRIILTMTFLILKRKHSNQWN